MNSEDNENDPDSSGCALKIREAAATASSEVGQLRSAGLVGQEPVDVELERIAHEQLRSQGRDVVGEQRRHDLDRLLIGIRRGEVSYKLVKKFLDENKGSPLKPEI